jgi:hypothetical protein
MRLLNITSKTYIAILIIFIVLSIGFVVSASATKGSYPGSNGKIAFDADDQQGFDNEDEDDHRSDTEIFVMNEDGTGVQQLTFTDIIFNDRNPCWSPDGKKIVFGTLDTSVWIMNSDGSNAFDLTPSMPSAGSPDYQRIPLAAVGGVSSPVNKLEILAPYLALAGLILAISTIFVKRFFQ